MSTFKAVLYSALFIVLNVTATTLPSQGCKGLIDFIFLIDGSDSISEPDYNKIKETLITMLDLLHVSPSEARMGVIVYGSEVTKRIPLSGNKTLLRNEISNLKQPRTGTNTALGIEAVRQMFTEQYKVKGVPKVGIVVTDGNSLDPTETIRIAFLAKNDGINMFSVGVSNSIDRMELAGIASTDQQVLTVDTFGDLVKSTSNLVKLICPTSFLTPWTTTTSTTTPPTTTVPSKLSTMAPISGPCDSCKMMNGVGYNPHPEDCDKFTQCYFGENKQIEAVYRQCPFGQYWDQDVLTCRPAENVFCHKEKCKLPGLLSYPYRTIKNNRGYWKCNLGKSMAMCCPEGYLYRPYQGCVEYDGETDPCPPNIYHEGACDSKPVFGNLTHYDQFVEGHGWLRRPCAPGTHYNPSDCACTFHASYIPGNKVCEPEVFIPFTNDLNDHSGRNTHIDNYNVTVDGSGYGYFDGSAKLVIPRFANFETYTDFVVKIRFLDMPSDRLEALVSNGDNCCDHIPSLALVKSRRNVHYMAKCDDDTVSTFHLPSMPGNWNEVYYIHDGLKLEGRNNGIQNENWAVGKLKKSTAGLQIGHGRLFQNFRGYMDYVAVYLCRPSYL